jgi:hypothetical protein
METAASQFILSCVIRRLHYREAARLIESVPPHLREQLLDLPAGPDRSITVFGILDALIRRYGMTEPQAQALLARFWSTLESWTEPEFYDEVRSTLYNERGKVAA